MRARRALLAAFAFTAVWFTGFFPPANNPNELSRIEALVASVETKTFSIDALIPRFGDPMDKSVWQGRFYSNKAPGLIFAAIPIYRLLRVFFVQPRSAWSPVFVLVRLATVTLLSLLALERLALRLEETPGGRDAAAVVAFATAFGTPFLYYARSFFSHAWTASLLFLSWDLLRSSEVRRRTGGGFLLAAGFLAGWAAISEYTAAVLALALAVRACLGAKGPRRRALLLFAAGAAPALLLLAWYNAACFGSPFRLSSACEAFPAYAELARRPLFGLGPPRLHALFATLLSASRGAILFSPFWLWSMTGWVKWWRSGFQRRDGVFTFVAVLLLWLPITGYPNWEGGWSLGMRYLLPVLFFAALPLGWTLTTPLSRGLFLAAVVFSCAFHLLASFSWPHFPVSVAWPVSSVSLWLIVHGAVAPNLGTLLGLPPLASLLAPLAVVVSAWVLCARELASTKPSRAAAGALGLAVFVATLLAPPAMSSSDLQWREGLAERMRRGAPP